MNNIQHIKHNPHHSETIVTHDNTEIREITRMDQLNKGTGYGKGSARRDNLTVYQRNYNDIFRKKNNTKTNTKTKTNNI